uniref:HIRAN domain-containing protein n=1 Tax=Amphimedon queenslandica TaxID=400682 RepID=A0A1X7UN36_AMPQE
MAVKFEVPSYIRGYHVYHEVWSSVLEENLLCERERNNSNDQYAVAVKKDAEIVGHLPRKLSRVCSLFLRRGGTITCKVSGRRRYSADLLQGGVEIPCCLMFSGEDCEIKKLKALMA